MEKAEAMEAKREELLELLAGLSEPKKKIAADLIQQASFMAVTLDDLAEKINQDGTTEEYTNGEHQRGRKISSDAKLYNSLIGRYSSIILKLMKLAPDKAPAGRCETPEKAMALAVEQRRQESEIHDKAFQEYVKAIQAGAIDQSDYDTFMEAEEQRQREIMAKK